MTDNSGSEFGRPDQRDEAAMAQPPLHSQSDADQANPDPSISSAYGPGPEPHGQPTYAQQPYQPAPYGSQPGQLPYADPTPPGYAPTADASGQQYGYPGSAQDLYGQQQGYAVQPYAQPGPGYGAPMLPEHPQATPVLILGVLGLFTSGVCSWIAWYMGAKAKNEIEAGAPYRWEGNLKTGYILGKVFGILAIIGVVLTIVFLIIIAILAAVSA